MSSRRLTIYTRYMYSSGGVRLYIPVLLILHLFFRFVFVVCSRAILTIFRERISCTAARPVFLSYVPWARAPGIPASLFCRHRLFGACDWFVFLLRTLCVNARAQIPPAYFGRLRTRITPLIFSDTPVGCYIRAC